MGNRETRSIDATPGQRSLQSSHVPTATSSKNANFHFNNIRLIISRVNTPGVKGTTTDSHY